MKKNVIRLFVLIFVCICTQARAQNERIDSLRKEYAEAVHDTSRVNILSSIAGGYEGLNQDSVLPIYLRALKIIDNNLSSATGKTLRAFLEIKAITLDNLGIFSQNEGKIYEGIDYFEQEFQLTKELKDTVGIIYSLNGLGAIYHNLGDIPKALDYFSRALTIAEKAGNSHGVSNELTNLGTVYDDQGDKQKAIEYYRRSLQLCEKTGYTEGEAIAVNNLAYVYSDLGDTLNARKLYLRALNLYTGIENNSGIATAYGNLGSIYNKEGNYSAALWCAEKDLALSEQTKDQEAISKSLRNIAQVLLNLKDTLNAEKTALKGLSVSRAVGYPDKIRDVSKILYLIYKGQHKSAKALEMHELFIQMRDSLINESNKKSFLKQQFKYEFEKRESTLKDEQEKKDELAKAESKKQKVVIGFIICGLILVLGFAGFIFRALRLTRKQKKIIELQKEFVEEKQKEILDSIYYARRIQRSLLTSEKYFVRKLNELNP